MWGGGGLAGGYGLCTALLYFRTNRHMTHFDGMSNMPHAIYIQYCAPGLEVKGEFNVCILPMEVFYYVSTKA